MIKTKSFLKYLKTINNSINNLLEKNLNKLNFKNLTFLFKNNKIILIFVAVFVVFITYLLLPTFYNQSDISKKLQNELQTKLEKNFKFSQNFKYNFFPRPHFTIEGSSIIDNKIQISKINSLKIFVSVENLFSVQNLKIKDLIIQNANFNLNKKNYNFFLDLLERDFTNGKLIIKDSNIFFKSFEGEVLFINKIMKMKYHYDSKESKNIISADNEIFNIPFSLDAFFNEDKNKIFSYIDINLIKLKIQNELSLNNKKKAGKIIFNYSNSKRVGNYEIEKNYFKFHIFDKIEEPNVTFKGEFNFKPFYANLEAVLDEINLNYLFGSNAIIAQLIKTEIFNNKNIDFNLFINAQKISNNINFKNIILISKIKEGLIDTDKTKFKWRNFADFELSETLIYVRDGQLVLDGKLEININNYNELFKFLLTPKNFRKKIKKINLNFTYNFDQNTAELNNIKIDNKINRNVNTILNNVILKTDDLHNKIYFKNLLNEAIKSYAG